MFNCESAQAKQKWVYCLKVLSDKPLAGLRWQSDWGEEPQLPHYLQEFYKKRKEKSLPKELRIIDNDDDNNNAENKVKGKEGEGEEEKEKEDEKLSPVKPYIYIIFTFFCNFLFLI